MQTERLLSKRTNKHRYKECINWYLMILIPIIGFLVFTLYPLIWSAAKSFFFYDGTVSTQRFVGWRNYLTLFKDETYWNSWLVTLKFAVLKLPIELPLAMFLAVLLNRKMKGSGFFRSLYYMPHVISVAIVGIIFSSMFEYMGFINGVLKKWGLIQTGIDWFSKQSTALFVLIFATTWASFGVNVMYFLAALQNVPEDLYESAYLDGASRARCFFQITLPLMGPVLQTILLLSINSTLHVNDLILVTTNGAPAGKTYSVMSYMTSSFLPGFASNTVNIGYGSATAVVTSILMCIIAVGYNKLSKKLSDIY